MDYDDNTCVQKLTPNFTPICSQINGWSHHCADVINESAALHEWCGEHDIYAPVQVPACMLIDPGTGNILQYQYFTPDTILTGCMGLAAQNPNWKLKFCYCCCSCFAYGTMIGVPSGAKAIQEIAVGETVLAASMKGGKPSWTPAPVAFSSGAAGGGHSVMVYLAFDRQGAKGDMVCTPDQVFVLANGKLARASKLQVGDQLMDQNGAPVPIHTAAIGQFKGGIHHVATGAPDDLEVDGHLLLAGGVVAGDYFLQLHLDSLPDSLKVADHEARPEIGSAGYTAAARAAPKTANLQFGLTPGTRAVEVQGGRFQIYQDQEDYRASGAVAMLTEAQAQDILANGEQTPITNPVAKSVVENLFKIYSGFYPDVVFYLDWDQMEPNVYALEQFDRKVVVVTGGLARTTALGYEGLAMAIAHGLGRFSDMEPRGYHGFAGTGVADYYAFGVASRQIWFANHWSDYVAPTFTQMKALFDLVSPKNAGGNPADPVDEPSIACRLQAINAGAGGGSVPACCGGAKVPLIGIETAEATTKGVVLTLSLAPTSDSAADPSNYTLTPPATITAAQVDPDQDFVIRLQATLEAGKTYLVGIRNLTSIAGSGVDPAHATAPCTVQ